MPSEKSERSASATSPMIQDLDLLASQNFEPRVTFVIKTTLISLRYLKELSVKDGTPIEQITCEQIINDFRRTANQMSDV